MTFKVLAFLHIFMMIGFGILQKAEAKDIPVCLLLRQRSQYL
ncbi:hypothetical protein MTR67_045500 [Solanum verrucosum]|uniref:Uncharacterized protein n=1 Tax=Solanum verrucosum TaxID=315347 RepID=A0AAF0ZWP8_SOLVR|nr:hypothetical protein MTR67_045500 [Solanum verrucosum]